MSVVISILRWLGVPLAFAAVMGICILLATWAVNVADGNCENMVGGACVEGWHTTVVEWATYIGIVVAFIMAPILSSKVAPTLERSTAVGVGILGNGPLWFGYIASGWGDLLLPACLAAGSAIIGIWLVWRRQDDGSVKESQA